MSDDLAPIPEFEGRAPIKLWRHVGIDCAIYMGTSAPCGYVRLPDASSLRPVAEAADVVFRAEYRDGMLQKFIDRVPEGRLGHEGLNELLNVHGGLTFGPTESGWVGFDTGHAFDIWDLDDLRQWIPDGPERDMFERLVSMGATVSQMTASHPVGWEIHWTLDKLVRCVEILADQVILMARVEK